MSVDICKARIFDKGIRPMGRDKESFKKNDVQNLFSRSHKESLNIDALALVRATNIQPIIGDDGSVFLDTGINGNRPVEKGFRTSLHFTLNHHVTSNSGGNWGASKYVVIAGFRETHEKNMAAKTGHHFIDSVQSVQLGALQPIDTFYMLGWGAKMELPNALVVSPDISGDGASLGGEALYKIDDRNTVYKAGDYTTDDLNKVLENCDLLVSINEYFDDIQKAEGKDNRKTIDKAEYEKIKKIASENKGAALRGLLQKVGHETALVAAIESSMMEAVKREATNRTLEAHGYPVQSGDSTDWRMSPHYISIAHDDLKQIGREMRAKYGYMRHSDTGLGWLGGRFDNAVSNFVREVRAKRENSGNDARAYPFFHPDFDWQIADVWESLHQKLHDPAFNLSTKFAAVRYIEKHTGMNVLQAMPDCPWRDVNGVPWYENGVKKAPHITNLHAYRDFVGKEEYEKYKETYEYNKYVKNHRFEKDSNRYKLRYFVRDLHLEIRYDLENKGLENTDMFRTVDNVCAQSHGLREKINPRQRLRQRDYNAIKRALAGFPCSAPLSEEKTREANKALQPILDKIGKTPQEIRQQAAFCHAHKREQISSMPTKNNTTQGQPSRRPTFHRLGM
ncbi:MAG: hypothetical protein HGA90_00975 [Alphaproteobacteria bacterium]|nr:hypothetical protein [Alphaproteobacteria bacterium]